MSLPFEVQRSMDGPICIVDQGVLNLSFIWPTHQLPIARHVLEPAAPAVTAWSDYSSDIAGLDRQSSASWHKGRGAKVGYVQAVTRAEAKIREQCT